MEKRKVWDELFLAYVAELDKDKPVIMAGDFNVAHQEIGTPLCDSTPRDRLDGPLTAPK